MESTLRSTVVVHRASTRTSGPAPACETRTDVVSSPRQFVQVPNAAVQCHRTAPECRDRGRSLPPRPRCRRMPRGHPPASSPRAHVERKPVADPPKPALSVSIAVVAGLRKYPSQATHQESESTLAAPVRVHWKMIAPASRTSVTWSRVSASRAAPSPRTCGRFRPSVASTISLRESRARNASTTSSTRSKRSSPCGSRPSAIRRRTSGSQSGCHSSTELSRIESAN